MGKHRPQRRAGRAQPEQADEQVIQRDIDDAGQRDKIHRGFGIAQTSENGTDDIVRRDERNSQKTYRQIARRSVNRLFRRGHGMNDQTDGQDQNGGQRDGQSHKQRRGVADVKSRAFFFVRADRLRDTDGGAHRQTDDHDCQHMHDLRSDGHGRNGGDGIVLADDKQVGHTVKRLQKVGNEIGNRKTNDAF